MPPRSDDLSFTLGELFEHLVRSPVGPLPAPVRRAADLEARRSGGLRTALGSRGDLPPDEDHWSDGLPEHLAAGAARPDAPAGAVEAAYAEAGSTPRALRALTRHVPRTRSGRYVPEVVALAQRANHVPGLVEMATMPDLAVAERLVVLGALDGEVAARGADACGSWLPDFVSELGAVMRNDVEFGRAALAALTSPELLAAASPTCLPEDPEVQSRICRALLARVRSAGSATVASADLLCSLLAVVDPTLARALRDDVLAAPWPVYLRGEPFAQSVPHAGPVSREVALRVPWVTALTYPDPYGHLADTLATVLYEALGEDQTRWDVLGRCALSFEGAVGELLDVVTGVSAPAAASAHG